MTTTKKPTSKVVKPFSKKLPKRIPKDKPKLPNKSRSTSDLKVVTCCITGSQIPNNLAVVATVGDEKKYISAELIVRFAVLDELWPSVKRERELIEERNKSGINGFQNGINYMKEKMNSVSEEELKGKSPKEIIEILASKCQEDVNSIIKKLN